MSQSSTEEESKITSKIVLLASPTNMIPTTTTNNNNKVKKNLQVFSFQHPKYKQMIKFGLLSVWEENNSNNGDDEELGNNSRTILLEVERIGGRYGSWFVGNNVISDGRPYVFSPMDVTFLLIGVLEEKVDHSNESHFDNMNDIIPSIILRVSNVRDMITNVCDIMEVGDDLFVRLSEEKVLAWMIAKSNSIVENITNNDKLRNSIVTPQGFKRSLKSKDASDDNKIRIESIRFLSEYMDRKWIEKLATHFEVIEEIYPSKGALSSTSFAKSPKKTNTTAALDFLDDLEAVEKKRKRKEEEEKSKKSKTQDSRSVSSLKKVNTKGMKSLDSFFKKK